MIAATMYLSARARNGYNSLCPGEEVCRSMPFGSILESFDGCYPHGWGVQGLLEVFLEVGGKFSAH